MLTYPSSGIIAKPIGASIPAKNVTMARCLVCKEYTSTTCLSESLQYNV